MTTTAKAIDERLAELGKRMSAFETARIEAERQIETYVTLIDDLARQMTSIHVARKSLESLPSSGADVEWRDRLIAWKRMLSNEMRALPLRIRDDHTLGVRRNLSLSIRAIDQGPDVVNGTGYDLTTLRLGALMIEAGYEVVGADRDRHYAGTLPWFGSLPQVERRIAEAEKLRAQAEMRLADALLDDAERERRAAENKACIAAENAKPVRKIRGHGSMFERHPNGRIVEIAG